MASGGPGAVMNLSLAAYKLTHPVAYALLPLVFAASGLLGSGQGRAARVLADLRQQANLYRGEQPPADRPRVWLQAASVGEVMVAAAVAGRLLARRPDIHLTISSSTSPGRAMAERLMGGRAAIIPYPLDLGLFTRRAIRAVQPHVYCAVETELWPDLIHRLCRAHTALMLINGRISPRSFGRYQATRPLWASCLGCFERLSMISQVDAERALALGAPEGAVSVGLSAKYDGMLERASAGVPGDTAARFNLQGRPLIVAGSVRGAEMGPVVSALAQVLAQREDAVIALAPRHVENAATWARALETAGLSWRAFSELSAEAPRDPRTRAVLVDTTGDLFDIYGLATAALVGGSLAALGGQNPMEPAAWGVPCLFGRSMEDFADVAQALVQAGGAGWVDGRDDLARALLAWLGDPAAAQEAGRAAREVLAAWPLAADEAARLIAEQLERKGVGA